MRIARSDRAALCLLVRGELAHYAAARRRGDTQAAWTALERAHIVSQPLLGPHLRVHAAMLGYAVRTRDLPEIAGQLARLALAPLGSITGRIPVSNTGRSTVSAFQPMPIPSDLVARIRAAVPPRP